MGRLLHRLLQGIVPSWLTRIKSSNPNSHKKRLHSFKTLFSKRKSSKGPALLAIAPHNDKTAENGEDQLLKQDAGSSDHLKEQAQSWTGQNPTCRVTLDDNDEDKSNSEMPGRSTGIRGSSSRALKEIFKQDAETPDSSPRFSVERHHGDEIPPNSQERRNRDEIVPNPNQGDEGEVLDSQETHHGDELISNSQEIHNRADELVLFSQGNIYDGSTDAIYGAIGYSNPEHRSIRKRKREFVIIQGDEMERKEEEVDYDGYGCTQENDEEEIDFGHDYDDVVDQSCAGFNKRRRTTKEGLSSCELPDCVISVIGNGKAVVKFSDHPGHAFWESMVEMIIENELWDTGSLEFLLHCYLSLNDPALHETIHRSFLQVLHDLHDSYT